MVDGGKMASGSNWLGFSLSPHMAMEAPTSPAHHHHPPPASTAATMLPSSGNNTCNFLFSPPAQMAAHSPGYYYIGGAYGDGTTTAGVYYSHPHLPAMPINMEGMMESSSPKLEDFLGGSNGGGHDDTVSYYSHHHQEGQEEDEANRNYDQYQHQHQLVPYNFQPLTEAEMLQAEAAAAAPMDEAMAAAAKDILATSYGAAWYRNNVDMEAHPLSLSMMSPGSQSSGCVGAAPLLQQQQVAAVAASAAASAAQGRSNGGGGGGEQCVAVGKKRGTGKGGSKQQQPAHRKSIDTFGQRTSQYRGVTRHRWTGRYEAHLWDNSCRKDGQSRKGRQVYLGGYDTEYKAGRAYDLAALKYWGPATNTNFPLENYQEEVEEMKTMSRLEFIAHLRRRSSGFSRGASMYRGVTRHHQQGRWQARIGRVAGNKDLYLGTYSTQEAAAEAYDIAAIKFRGLSAVTNFGISRYDVDKIMESNTLLPAEEVYKAKAIQAANNAVSVMHIGRELNTAVEASAASTDWRMVLHGSSPHEAGPPCSNEAVDLQKNGIMDDRRSSTLPHGIDQHHDLDVSGRTGGGITFSNSSSLVTSLGNSREGSSERLDQTMLYARHPNATGMVTMNAWNMQMPPPQEPRPLSAVSHHHPVFAAWADA